MAQKPKIDYTKLTPEQRKELREDKNAQKQLQYLSDIADMTQEVIGQLDDRNSDEGIDNLGVLLVDIKESLTKLNSKDAPKIPDYAKPVVASVTSLEKKLSAAIKGIDVKPSVNVEAPKVELGDTVVDLKGVEEVLRKELPKAFNEAILMSPQPPTIDFTPLLMKMDEQMQILQSIDTASRLIPQAPVRVQATNPDGSNIVDAGKLVTEKYDYVDVQQTSSTVETYVYKEGGSGGLLVATVTMNYTDSSKSEIDTMTKV